MDQRPAKENSISEAARTSVIVGVDTHADTHHAAVIDEHGRHLRDQKFPTTPKGYLELIAFVTTDNVLGIGVEGTGSYGLFYVLSSRCRFFEVERTSARRRLHSCA